MNRHRVQAFTILEVTITMLLAAVVIGITYEAFSIVSKSYISFQKKNDDMAVLSRLDELLKKDFAHADTIAKIQNGLVFKSNKNTTTYDIEPDFIVRTNIITDTFKVRSQEVTMLFENQPITDIAQIEEQNRIDELQMSILYQDQKIAYHYHKDYSSANLIERNPNAIN